MHSRGQVNFRHHCSAVFSKASVVFILQLCWRLWQMLITCLALKATQTVTLYPGNAHPSTFPLYNLVLLQKLLLLWSTAWSPASTCLHQSSRSDTSHRAPHILCMFFFFSWRREWTLLVTYPEFIIKPKLDNGRFHTGIKLRPDNGPQVERNAQV